MSRPQQAAARSHIHALAYEDPSAGCLSSITLWKNAIIAVMGSKCITLVTGLAQVDRLSGLCVHLADLWCSCGLADWLLRQNSTIGSSSGPWEEPNFAASSLKDAIAGTLCFPRCPGYADYMFSLREMHRRSALTSTGRFVHSACLDVIHVVLVKCSGVHLECIFQSDSLPFRSCCNLTHTPQLPVPS